MSMRATQVVSTAALALGLAAGAEAQQPAPSGAAGSAQVGGQVNVDQLPVDLARIQRRLQRSAEREERDGLNLKYFVDVYGQAPPLQFFTKQDNLQAGPVPYGAPTHQQMLEMMTPKEYRAPVADFGALARWLVSKARK